MPRKLKRGIEDPDVIATILEHIRAREATELAQPRAPPARETFAETTGNSDRMTNSPHTGNPHDKCPRADYSSYVARDLSAFTEGICRTPTHGGKS